jgi:hypothetical protein
MSSAGFSAPSAHLVAPAAQPRQSLAYLRAVTALCGVGLAFIVVGCAAILSSPGHWGQFTAPRGITFRGPSDLKPEPAAGDGGLLAAYRCPRYYFAISWESYDATAIGDTAWSQVPRREVELGEGYGGLWPCGAALHIKWLRPAATRPARARALPAHQQGPHLIPLTDGDSRDFRVLHFSAGCKTRRDRDEVVKVFRTVRFNPW